MTVWSRAKQRVVSSRSRPEHIGQIWSHTVNSIQHCHPRDQGSRNRAAARVLPTCGSIGASTPRTKNAATRLARLDCGQKPTQPRNSCSRDSICHQSQWQRALDSTLRGLHDQGQSRRCLCASQDDPSVKNFHQST